MFWASVKLRAARSGAKVIAVPACTRATNCWFSVTVLLLESTAATMVPLARPVPVAAMPTLTVAAEPKLKVVAPAAADVLAASVTLAPGSEFRTVRTAASSAANGGGVPSVGSCSDSGFVSDGGAGSGRYRLGVRATH